MVDRFQHLFDSLTEEVVVVDRDLRIAYANPAWMHRVGLSPSQVFGHPCYKVLSETDIPCSTATCAVQQVFETGQPTRSTCQGLEQRSHGENLLVSASPVFDRQGQIVEVAQILVASPAESLSDSAIILHRDVTDALREAALITTSGQDLQATLDAILDQLHRVVDYDSASIALLENKGWRLIAGRGFPPMPR